MPKKALKPRLTSKKYKDKKLNMTLHGLRIDFYDAYSKFYTDEQREEHRIISNSKGQCTDVYEGNILNFGPLKDQWEKGKEGINSKFIWVMDDSGNMYVDFHSEADGIFHSAMMGGFRPIAAGEICIVDGYIVMLNEESGHYAPNGTLNLVIEILKEQEFVMPDVTLNHSKHSADIKRVTKQDVRSHLIKVNKAIAGLKQEGFKA